MKKIIFSTLTIVLCLSIGIIASGQPIHLMTYNIKNDYQKTGENNWDSRKAEMIQLLNFYEPNIFGVQEALQNQINYLDSNLTNYTFIGIGREDGKTKGEYSAIFYDSTLFNVMEQNTFWLSEIPSKVSKGWDAAYERICTYGLFEVKNTHEKFWVFNTHFDHIGVEARKNSVALILEKTNSLNTQNYPLLVMGDFNLTPVQLPIQLMKKELNDAIDISIKPKYGPVGTFNGFSEDLISDRIDYFFVKKIDVLSYMHIDDRLKSGLWVSDHLPVMISVNLK